MNKKMLLLALFALVGLNTPVAKGFRSRNHLGYIPAEQEKTDRNAAVVEQHTAGAMKKLGARAYDVCLSTPTRKAIVGTIAALAATYGLSVAIPCAASYFGVSMETILSHIPADLLKEYAVSSASSVWSGITSAASTAWSYTGSALLNWWTNAAAQEAAREACLANAETVCRAGNFLGYCTRSGLEAARAACRG